MPTFQFDPHENALEWDEPKVLFTAARRPVSEIELPDGAKLTPESIVIQMKFAMLFREDGGPVTDDDLGCALIHASGLSQSAGSEPAAAGLGRAAACRFPQ